MPSLLPGTRTSLLPGTMTSLLPLLCLLPCSLAASPSPGCARPLPALPGPGHSHNFPFQVEDPLMGSVSRKYRVHLPTHWGDNSRPRPLLLDYHGWTEHAGGHEDDGHDFFTVADEDEEGGFLLVTPEGMGDVGEEKGWGSWNVSRTQGPLGDICDTNRTRWGEITCYDSCEFCDPLHSCDWATCYDDVVFTNTLLDKIVSEYCIDLDSIHQSGVSNGGMFSYHTAAHIDRFASIGPVAGAPLLGYSSVPDRPLSIIDFHGTLDDTIPYSLATSGGEGPDGTVMSFDGYYYYDKPRVVTTWAEGLGCGEAAPWPTGMDGENNFSCIIHSGCRGGGEVVHCHAAYGHDYPFGPDRYIEGSRIMWNFMKAHPKQPTP